MKTGFIVLFLCLVTFLGFAQEVFEPASGEEVLIDLQGENDKFWILSFYQEGDNHEEVKTLIMDSMKEKFPKGEYQFGEVNLASGFEFQKLFETLDLLGEPKRGKTTPQVLTMQAGEGFIIYGSEIAEGVVKRFAEVKDGKVFNKEGKDTKTTTR